MLNSFFFFLQKRFFKNAVYNLFFRHSKSIAPFCQLGAIVLCRQGRYSKKKLFITVDKPIFFIHNLVDLWCSSGGLMVQYRWTYGAIRLKKDNNCNASRGGGTKDLRTKKRTLGTDKTVDNSTLEGLCPSPPASLHKRT